MAGVGSCFLLPVAAPLVAILLGTTGYPEPREPLQPLPVPMKLQGPQLLAFVCWLVGKFFTPEAESYTKHR